MDRGIIHKYQNIFFLEENFIRCPELKQKCWEGGSIDTSFENLEAKNKFFQNGTDNGMIICSIIGLDHVRFIFWCPAIEWTHGVVKANLINKNWIHQGMISDNIP